MAFGPIVFYILDISNLILRRTVKNYTRRSLVNISRVGDFPLFYLFLRESSSNEMGNGMATNLFKRIQWICFESSIPNYLQRFPNLSFDVGSIIEK